MKVFKNKKQRIVAVFLSMVFAFMLVPFTDAYADSVVDIGSSAMVVSEDGELELPFKVTGNASPVYCVYINGLNQWVFVSKTPFNSVYYDNYGQEEYDYSSSGWVRLSDGTEVDPAYYYHAYGNFGRVDGKWYSDFKGPHYRINANDLTNSTKLFLYALVNGDTTGFDCTFADSESGYSNEIGALKNVSRNTLYPDHANNVDSVFWRFRYASKTTKGYNVKTKGTKIRVYESVTYYKRSDDSVYSESPKVLVGEYDATSLQFDMNVNEAFNKTTSETDSQYIANAWTIMTKQIVRNDRIYLQVVDADGNYGDYLRIGGHADNASNATDNPQDVVDEDGNNVSEENGGYSTDDTDGDVGTSIDGDLDTADDDANSKPEEKENIGDSLDHAISTIRSLIDMIRHIPEIISILFSFLPSWCLSVVALGFVALVVLIAYKLIRG